MKFTTVIIALLVTVFSASANANPDKIKLESCNIVKTGDYNIYRIKYKALPNSGAPNNVSYSVFKFSINKDNTALSLKGIYGKYSGAEMLWDGKYKKSAFYIDIESLPETLRPREIFQIKYNGKTYASVHNLSMASEEFKKNIEDAVGKNKNFDIVLSCYTNREGNKQQEYHSDFSLEERECYSGFSLRNSQGKYIDNTQVEQSYKDSNSIDNCR